MSTYRATAPSMNVTAPPLAFVTAVLFLTSFIAFHDLSFPLSLVGDASGLSEQMARKVDEGNILRQVCIPIIGALGLYMLGRPDRRRLSPFSLLGIIFSSYVVWVLLSVSWSDNPELTVRRLFVFLFLVVGAVGMASIDARSIRTIFVWLALATFVVGFTNEIAIGTFAPWRGEYRFSGTVHPNLQAASMAQLALTGLCFVLDPSIRRRWVGPALLVLGVLVVLSTQSRTSLVAFAVASAVVIVIWAQGSARAALLLGAAIFAVIGSLEVFLGVVDPEASPTAIVTSWLEKPRDQGNIQSLTGRTDVWETCIRMAMDRPLTGAGFESFWTPQRITEVSSLHQWAINQSHSVYIEHLVSLGIVGLTLWCCVLVGGFVAAVRRYRVSRSAGMLWIAGQITFCIIHGFSESINMMPLFNGFIIICIISYIALYRNEALWP